MLLFELKSVLIKILCSFFSGHSSDSMIQWFWQTINLKREIVWLGANKIGFNLKLTPRRWVHNWLALSDHRTQHFVCQNAVSTKLASLFLKADSVIQANLEQMLGWCLLKKLVVNNLLAGELANVWHRQSPLWSDKTILFLQNADVIPATGK